MNMNRREKPTTSPMFKSAFALFIGAASLLAADSKAPVAAQKLEPPPPKVAATNPPPPSVSLEDFKLVGEFHELNATFTLNVTAIVEDAKGSSLDLLTGKLAMTEINSNPRWRVRADQDKYVLVFDKPGKFPIRIKFNAAVTQHDAWKSVAFHVAPGVLEATSLKGLGADTQFDFPGAARPERKGDDFVTYLPTDGTVNLSWKEKRPESEGKLFYAAEMLSQITVSPGLMRQTDLLEYKVMQGELSRVVLLLRGEGEVTRVQGEQVLSWNIESPANSGERRLVVQFNQPQKDQFSLQVHLQTPLGAFPQSVEAIHVRPDQATRFAGVFRIVNEGAVRLEVSQASGLSQISPEQFPETETTKAIMHVTGSQKFVYRFSGPDFALRIQADQVLPEISVSELLSYRLGESELAVDAELELDVREAPLRDLVLHVPKGYALARVNAPNLSDYFLRDGVESEPSELRLVFGQPVSGRQVIQLRLEKNKPLSDAVWDLPRLEVVRARSVRGHISIASDPGFRLTPERTQSLTEIATAFFPRKIAGIQSAFRLSDPAWSASVRVERLPQTVQADVLHLFSIGEGIAYGSSVINYVVSGAPMAAFNVELPSDFFNVEFTGKDIRNWQKVERGYLVQLHTPVTGPYTLLATYERPFKSQGETLAFTGARPLDAQSEQGHTLVISAYQFQVRPVDVSTGLLPIEPGEVPPEYRLFFDSPILTAYRYTTRPFNLKLELSPLAQGDSVSQVVDRASLTTHISKEGQVLTDVHYFVKSRGNPHFRMKLPPQTELWSATVNGVPVVPVIDGTDNLIPLPQRPDPNAVQRLDLKLASRSKNSARVRVSVPALEAPVLLEEWQLEPDAKQRLAYSSGSLTPLGGIADISGFAGLARMFDSAQASSTLRSMLLFLAFITGTVIFWVWARHRGGHRFSVRHVAGLLLGTIAFTFAIAGFLNLLDAAGEQARVMPRNITFLAPVQQDKTPLSVEVANLHDSFNVIDLFGYCWPALLGFVLWGYGWITNNRVSRTVGAAAGWTLLAWAALRFPNGAPVFWSTIGAFLLAHILVPALRQALKIPSRQTRQSPVEPGAAAAAVPALAMGGLIWLTLGTGCVAPGSHVGPALESKSAVPESVTQEVRIEEKFALGTATIRWLARKDQSLPLLFDPAVLTRLRFPTNDVRLVQPPPGSHRPYELIAEKAATVQVELQYQLQPVKRDSETGFTVPLPFGLINRMQLSVSNLDVDVTSPQAVAIDRENFGSNTTANLTFSPSKDIWVAWKPRTRDVKHEKPVFYVDVSQLYIPAAGVIEGIHYFSIRPAQGELTELSMDIPKGATVTDVLDPGKPVASSGTATKLSDSLVSLWRFDPDARKLRVTLNPPQSRPFTLIVRSQIATGPLPVEQSVGLIRVENAAGQIGLVGFATGNDVQLDSVSTENASPINLEDFPQIAAPAIQAQFPGLTVRRAFRYSDPKAVASVKASAVEPDVRVETQDTLSLGEDRTLLAVNAAVDITRAGIFRLSFKLPGDFDVESISGPAMSHWTEAKSEGARIITLHLTGKSQGQIQFAISLTGPGLKSAKAWNAPQILFREASKQRGTLLVVPEQGMRLQVATRDGITPLDPQKSGIRQKGVLAFRVLQTPWSLALDVEQVDPWIQVTSLQQASVNDGQVKVTASLQYQIENTGLKAFRVFIPTNAEGVRFQGDQLADFIKASDPATNGLQAWDIKLHRRIIGNYLLQASWQTPIPEGAKDTTLRGILAGGVNLQRGFVTVQSVGRLQVNVTSLPEALQPAEWQSIPRNMLPDRQPSAANAAYRLVEPAFALTLPLQRHEAAQLLPARVNKIDFDSVISDDGIMLTHVRMEMFPEDKRLLALTLPTGSRFWFAFVNQSGVWPWRQGDKILIPLDQPWRGRAVPVELFYSSSVGHADPKDLDLQLLAPQFDLPLENLTWRVALNDKWKLRKWAGALQLQSEQVLDSSSKLDLQTYLNQETTRQQQRTKEAESFLAAGNSALEQADPQQARRAFSAAYGLSGHDAAFNEDARVQLHNIKLQEALMGLNARQSAAAGDRGELTARLRDLRGGREVSYSQQDAKDLIDRNTADENAAFMRVAERLIQQQDAAASTPAALRANIPEQGRVLTFQRSVVVDKWADLRINLRATAAKAASKSTRLLILLAVFVLFTLCYRVAQSALGQKSGETNPV